MSKFKLNLIVVCFCVSAFVPVFGQNQDKKSVLYDTNLVNHWYNKAVSFQSNQNDSAYYYALKAYKKSKAINYPGGLARALNEMGQYYNGISEYQKAVNCFLGVLSLIKTNPNQRLEAECKVNLSSSYLGLQKHSEALSLYPEILAYFRKINDSVNVGIVYNNIAVCYDNMGVKDSAITYYDRAFPYITKSPDLSFVGLWYLNVGDLLRQQGKLKQALSTQLKAEYLLKKIDNKPFLLTLYAGMITTYDSLRQFKKAVECGLKAAELGRSLGAKNELSEVYFLLAGIYAKQKDHVLEAKNLRLYAKLRDSVYQQNSAEALAELQSKYETEQKQMMIEKLQYEKKQEQLLSAKDRKTRNVIIFSVGFCLLVLLVFSVFLYKRFKLTSYQKKIIEQQKNVVDEKQREILDSIAYAKRIQMAILPSEQYIERCMTKQQ